MNKGDLISRSALKDKLTDTINPNDIAKNEWYEGYAACVQVLSDLIDNAPTVIENGLIAEDYIKEKMFFVKRECDVQSIPVIAVNDLVAFERTQGEWKRHDEWRNGEYIGGFYHVNCPNENGYYSKWTTNYCPNCGADMRGGAE